MDSKTVDKTLETQREKVLKQIEDKRLGETELLIMNEAEWKEQAKTEFGFFLERNFNSFLVLSHNNVSFGVTDVEKKFIDEDGDEQTIEINDVEELKSLIKALPNESFENTKQSSEIEKDEIKTEIIYTLGSLDRGDAFELQVKTHFSFHDVQKLHDREVE